VRVEIRRVVVELEIRVGALEGGSVQLLESVAKLEKPDAAAGEAPLPP
jgi:hypothetical protein